MKTMRASGWALLALAVVAGGLWWLVGLVKPDERKPVVSTVSRPAQFTGAQSCAACHQTEFESWQGSHHQLAMQPAAEDTVLADFNDTRFVHYGVTSRFFRADGAFMVETDGPDGVLTQYEVSHVIGVEPLQQYMIGFPDGRIQVLGICWDTRPESEGGQRWYHLYPDEPIPHDDVLHWTGPNFNWNYMCADCHVTGYEKNYDLNTARYDSQWHEGMVSCEACHGPGSEHIAWVADYEAGEKEDPHGDMGLVVRLKEAQVAHWILNSESGQPERSHPLESTVQVESCARCHSHRRPLQNHFIHGQSFHDTHRVSVLEDRLYHADGQIDEEVYVYGSFTQSRMYHKGVRCSDCHDPHSQKLLAEGNALCVRCHDATKYDVASHHFHPDGGPGSQCVDCHMPGKNFMGIDFRRDHSLRIPRPDLAEALGAPDACTQCHADQKPAWAAAELAKRFGEQTRPHYGTAFAAAHNRKPDAWKDLITIAHNPELPGIVRATAMHLLREYPRQEVVNAVIQNLSDEEPLVREHAAAALAMLPPGQRYSIAKPLLVDPVRVVRLETIRQLAAVSEQQMSPQDRVLRMNGIEEFRKSEMAVGDRPGAHMVLGLLYSDLGHHLQAEASYRKAMKMDPSHIPSRVNLAELYYTMGRVDDGELLLKEALRYNPQEGIVHEALGMLYIRQKKYDNALKALERAAAMMPERARTHYMYGVALNDRGRPKEAVESLIKAHDLEPANTEYLIGIITISRDAGDRETAIRYARKLEALEPGNPQYRQLLESL